MNILLIFFALPIATIIISIALQRILKCPPLVAAVIFAIFLIVTFIINRIEFLVDAIIFAIISFITAAIVCFICRFFDRCDCHDRCRWRRDNNCDIENTNRNELLTINSSCQNNCNDCDNDSDCNSNFGFVSTRNGVTTRINVSPNSTNNRRNCCFCRNCRRR